MRAPTDKTVPAHSALDPRTLGRPVHLLGEFAALLRHDLVERVHTSLNRRYQSRFELGEVSIAQLEAPAPSQSQRWLLFDAPTGEIGFALERPLLLSLLDYRYGAGAAPAKGASHPETATEERLAAMLARQFIGTVTRRIAMLPGVSVDAGELRDGRRDAPAPRAWTLRAELSEHGHGVDGVLWITLGQGWMEQVFRGLAPARHSTPPAAVQLGNALQLDLCTRLLETELPLGVLLDARVGDVIPIDLGPTAVLVNDSLLFRADVAEHKGKLCLTSFQDVD